MQRPLPQWKACKSMETLKLQQVWYKPMTLFAGQKLELYGQTLSPIYQDFCDYS